MVGGIIVTHGRLAIELVTAAEMIVGEIKHIIAVSIGWNDELEQGLKEIEQAIKKVNQGSGVLILTDMFGGTPTNVAMTFSQPGKVEIITGVNLPMIIKLASQQKDESLSILAGKVREQGQKNIYIASEVMAPKR
ncbi:MAG: PTS sugar transporter subunit IIA [Blastocatellia bacterium]|nr:PTS sugar transporter subunit IIA [Blastocatellia bacterium]MBN8722471.1 PTS sugar transporter subunit IIA [Acidobacteriota bacterium]